MKKDDIFYRDLEALDEIFRLNSENDIENHEKYREAMKTFNNKRENHNITTLGQKIDFFVYLFNKDSSINLINPRIVDLKHNLYGNNPNSNFLKKQEKTLEIQECQYFQ